MPKPIKLAIAGVGRGKAFFEPFLAHSETELVALCDVDESRLAGAGKTAGVTALYTLYEKMLDEARPDAVVIASPMQFHAAQALAALERQIHVLCEVTAAVSLDEARWLAQGCRRSKAVYMMGENLLYYKTVMLVQNMVDAGLFGEVYYAEGEYLHNVRHLHHTADGRPTWRYYWQVGINGANYATHSIGPCLFWMHDRPDRVSCIGSGRWSDPEHAMEDSVLMLCKTKSGKLIRIRLDMLSPRPYALTYTLQGTKGVYESARQPGGQHSVCIEGYGEREKWLPLETFEVEFLPEIWRNPPQEALESGHLGSDYFTAVDFIDAVQGRKPPKIGIHEALDMTLPGLVSQASIARDGEWLPVPDSREW